MQSQGRIFNPFQKRPGLTLPRKSSKKMSALQQLIVTQDWQRVLVRCKLYPNELKEFFKFHLSDEVYVKVLPLHLVCALNPPATVVELFLELYGDAARLPIRPRKSRPREPKPPSTLAALSPKLKGRFRRRRPLRDRIQQWRRLRKASSTDVSVEEYQDAQQGLLRNSFVSESSLLYLTAN
jgi:hypothetical protein